MNKNAEYFSKYPNKHKVVLGEGEGPHTHLLVSDKPVQVKDSKKTQRNLEEELDALLEGTGVLRHEEHDPMVFEAGCEIKRYHQQEYNPFNDQMQRAFD